MNEEERNSIEKVENLIKRCDECKLKECINCETNYTEITSIKRIVDSYKRLLKENETLKKEKEQAWEEWNNLEQGSYETEQKLKQQIKELRKENEELKSKLENKDKYFELIIGLGYDYDGYYNREIGNGNIKDLADLIDELVQAARDGSNDIPYQK